MLLLGLFLAGCSTSAQETAPEASNGSASVTGTSDAPVDVETPATPSKPSETADATAAAKPSENAASKARKVTMHVEGAKSNALVKALVVTADGKESGGEMTSQTLPFDQEVTLPADSVFTKVLVLGKYPSGGTGEISCSISIDDVSVSSQASSSHKPAECLFVEKGSK